MKDYLEVMDLARSDLDRVLALAVEARQAPHSRAGLLGDEIVFCYFDKPSTRTRVSFSAAISHLGGEAEFVGPAELQLGRGETIEDTAMVVSRYARAVVIRTFAHNDVVRFARAATVPVINALTDLHHPCQALADLMTIRDHLPNVDRIKLAYVGAGNNVCHSLVQAGALTGLSIVVATPAQLAPNSDVVSEARVIGKSTGASIELINDPERAVAGANVVYTDVWLSMGDPLEQQDARRQLLEPYRVDEQLMATAASGAIFMHCLPAHRGDEVVDEVIDGPQSVVADQAENRMHTEQGLLVALLTESLTGRSR
ncbi:MAG TPA: ornithine carbamoyltransferase [Acidimicrobiia bacterium]|jgi:ornithine carbamoyltransferase